MAAMGRWPMRGRSLWLKKVLGGEFVELLQDLEEKGCQWDDSCLARFNKFLGFSMEGFEGDQNSRYNPGVVHSFGVGRFLGWGAVSARGAAGGVVVFWDNRVLELVGDFNVIRFPNERSREGRMSGSMRRFSEVIDELALRDLPFQGGPFTWSGGLNGLSRSRLDRFLISEDWENHFSGEEGFKELLKDWWQDQGIQRGVVRAYQNLLSDLGGWHPSMDSLEFGRSGVEEATRLEEMFFVEEVFLALSELNGDKALGPDGFSLAFWQFCWDFVKDEIMGFFKDFFEGKIVKSLNTTFLVLVPKKGGANDLCDFRPISLVGGLYKLLAKVLANRLKKWELFLPLIWGSPLGASHKSVVVWDSVEERMWKRLALWKRQFILREGESLPYGALWDFLWGGGALEKRPHLVKSFNDWEVEGGGKAPFDLARKEANRWCGGQSGVGKWSKNEIFSVKSLYSLDPSCAVPFVEYHVGALVFLQRGDNKSHPCALPKMRVLWDLVFSLFGVNWVLPLTVRDTLLGWFASFVDKKCGKTWREGSSLFILDGLEERNRIVFDNEVLSI
ncbi:hypothetical protein CK203_108407 [Vitis vinifera]|uniref:Uncharacterized protein n=1 Tax=Vitis vinifera TaxID=29760 RepID=A0A438E285_VITVI|nr:hypothetical protein CK203_108407 [Vitis vinifera]